MFCIILLGSQKAPLAAFLCSCLLKTSWICQVGVVFLQNRVTKGPLCSGTVHICIMQCVLMCVCNVIKLCERVSGEKSGPAMDHDQTSQWGS